MSKLIFIADMITSQACQTPVKMMHMYMNRFAIDEAAAFEIISVETLSVRDIILTPTDRRKFFLDSKHIGENRDVSEQEYLYDLTKRTFENVEQIEYVIESSLQTAEEFENELDLKKSSRINIHLIYAGNAFNWMDVEGHVLGNNISPDKYQGMVKDFVHNALKSIEINSIMLTFLDMWKYNVITQAIAEEFSHGKIKTNNGGIIDSVYDDLETFFFKTWHNDTLEEKKLLYLISSFSESEKQLFENKDFDHLTSYLWFWSGKDPGVQKDSESDIETEHNTKFVRWACERETIVVENKNPSTIFNMLKRLF